MFLAFSLSLPLTLFAASLTQPGHGAEIGKERRVLGTKGSVILSDRPCGLIMANSMPREFPGLLLREAKRDACALAFMHALVFFVS